MNASSKLLLVLFSSALCQACTGNAATAPTHKDRACLFANQPQRWRVLDQRQLILWGPSRTDAYLVELFSSSSDIGFAETLAFIDDDHDGRICAGDKIAVPDSHMASLPAIISSMRKVDEAELMALGEKHKVKLISDKKAQELKSHDKHTPAEPEPERSK